MHRSYPYLSPLRDCMVPDRWLVVARGPGSTGDVDSFPRCRSHSGPNDHIVDGDITEGDDGAAAQRAAGKERCMSSVRVLVGTRKGAFILTSDGRRERWDVSGPHFGGWEIYHLKGSPADPQRLYASQTSGWFGQVIQRSSDGGKSWETVGNKFVYDGPTGTHQWYDGTPHPWEFARVWHLEPSPTDPDTVYAGVEDAALFLSLIHISEPTRLLSISYAVFCLKKK